MEMPTVDAFGNCHEWATRNQFWLDIAQCSSPKRKRRERNSQPLILCGHGISLRTEHGSLIIRDGFTHYPQQQAIHRLFPGSRDVPERILLLDGSGTLSFDVLSWLAEQGVALARIKWTGEVAIALGGSGHASDREKVKWQHEQRAEPAKQIAFAIDLVRRKLIASIETLEQCIAPSPKRATAIDWHHTAIDRLKTAKFNDVNELRGVEAQSASLYFAAWKGLAIAWKGKRAIPDDWQSFTLRSSLANGAKPTNRCASHPVNAMLNYAYAVKLAHMQIETVAQGYDPTIGILHHGRRGKPAYVLDIIEAERPKIDAKILGFIQNRSFAAADFILRPDGVCRLSPQLARAVASLI